MKRANFNNSGMILMITLWALGVLSIFALSLGYGIRQKITFLSQIEKRQTVAQVAQAGVKKAVALLNETQKNPLNSVAKQRLMNNSENFQGISLGNALFNVSYDVFDKTFKQKITAYGIMAEEGKLNINTATYPELVRLLRYTLGFREERAKNLALAMIDWREWGESTFSGFKSDSYYAKQPDPYEPKNDLFEILDELLLVKDMSPEIFERILPFVTIFGDGKVDVNTASWQVLVAIGFDESVADQILSVRRGLDRKEATDDDIIFMSVDHFRSVMIERGSLGGPEVQQMDHLINSGKITTDSVFYAIWVRASMDNDTRRASIRCVYDTQAQAFTYWREE